MKTVDAAFAEASKLSQYVTRYPDGEPGERDTWMVFQLPLLYAHPMLEVEPDVPTGLYLPFKRVRFKAETFNEAEFDLGPLGYAKAALTSFAQFRKLDLKGKFQVCSSQQDCVMLNEVLRCQNRSRYQPLLLLQLLQSLLDLRQLWSGFTTDNS